MAKKRSAPRDQARASREKKLPKTYRRFADRFPGIAEAHRQMNDAAREAGPLDAKACELVKMGIALGAGLESSFHSHVRRALAQGATQAEIEQAVVLAASTCGFSRAVAGWRWAGEHF